MLYIHTFQCIERAFGRLLGRFKRLRYLNMKSEEKRVRVVAVGCMLHNYCNRTGDTDVSALDMNLENVSTKTHGEK